MHRSYTQHSPIQIIRDSNRIEIRNVSGMCASRGGRARRRGSAR